MEPPLIDWPGLPCGSRRGGGQGVPACPRDRAAPSEASIGYGGPEKDGGFFTIKFGGYNQVMVI